MTAPQIVNTIGLLRTRLAAVRREGARIGLVPTMGALHDGHLSLVQKTRKHADKVVVSIFVNPTQFAPHEDFDSYPRTLDADARKLAVAGGTDLIFAPSVGEMYPQGFATRIEVGGPSRGLETDFRPHFFAGVATIVAKLLLAVMPDAATFGEKDYQQLLVVRRLSADLGLATEIIGAPIIRESDGLAMSSRNATLKPDERRIAGQMNVVLKRVIADLRGGMPIATAEEAGKRDLLEAGFVSVDYVAVRDANSLEPIDSLAGPARVLAAAKVGSTRLIDNLAA
jgi:pantoate--beta-alanine ligase